MKVTSSCGIVKLLWQLFIVIWRDKMAKFSQFMRIIRLNL